MENHKVNTINTINQMESANRELLLKKNERTYVEIPVLRNEPKDVLQQLQSNLARLEDRAGRLNFLLGEVRSAIRR